MEQKKREYEAERKALEKAAEEEARRALEEENNMLTYSREDAKNQVNNKQSPRNRSLGKYSVRNIVRKRKPTLREQTLRKTQCLQPKSKRNHSSSSNVAKIEVPQKDSSAPAPRPSPRKCLRSTRASQQSPDTTPNRAIGKRLLCTRTPEESRSKRPRVSLILNSNGTNDARECADNGHLKSNYKHRIVSNDDFDVDSDGFSDSECSLDVMKDSTDAGESEDATRSSNTPTSASAVVDSDESGNDGIDEIDRHDRDVSSLISPTHLISKPVNSGDDDRAENSNSRTRSTRSRTGRLDIDLFALDESQPLSDTRRSHNRSRVFNANSVNSPTATVTHNKLDSGTNDEGNMDNDKVHNDDSLNATTCIDLLSDDEDERNGVESIATKSRQRIDVENCDNLSFENNINSNSNKLKNVRTVRLRNDISHESPHSISNIGSSGEKVKNILKAHSGKNQNTLDGYIQLSPKIVLNKAECNLPSTVKRNRTVNTTADHTINQNTGHDLS